jgi:hypothetical protein
MSENEELKFAGAAGEAGQGSPTESVNPSKVVESLVEPETKFLTVDQFAAYQKEMSLKLEETRRNAQGMVDRSSNRLEQKFAELTDPYKKLGMQLTPEQEQALRTQILFDSYGQQPQPYQQYAPAQAQPVEKVDQVTIKANGILDAYDVKVDKSSPNIRLIDTGTTDEKVFLKSVKAYAEAEAKSREQKPVTASAEAQLPMGGAGTSDLMSQYQDELKKLPRGTVSQKARVLLNDKYRKLGLRGI